MTKQKIFSVLCLQADGGIGKDNKVLYPSKEIPGDMERFIKITTGNIVIMGRKTWESLRRSLPNRINIVVSNQKDYQNTLPEGVICFDSIEKAIAYAKQTYPEKHIAIMGGAQIYEKLWGLCDYVYATEVFHKKDADTFVELPKNLIEVNRESKKSESGILYDFVDYEVVHGRV